MTQAKGLEAAQDRDLQKAKTAVDARIHDARPRQKVKTQINAQGLVIRLVTDKVLFDLGSSTIRPAAVPAAERPSRTS